MKSIFILIFLTYASLANAASPAPPDAQLFRTESLNDEGKQIPTYQVISANLKIPTNLLMKQDREAISNSSPNCCADLKAFYAEGKLIAVLPKFGGYYEERGKFDATSALVEELISKKVDFCSISFRVPKQNKIPAVLNIQYETKVGGHGIFWKTEGAGVHQKLKMLFYDSYNPDSITTDKYINSGNIECRTYNASNLKALNTTDSYIPVSVLTNSVGQERIKVIEY